MKVNIRLLVSYPLITAFAACATERQPAPPNSDLTISGRYEYIDGDRLIWRCSDDRECTDTLIRDERLQHEIEISPEMFLTLRVGRVAACGPQSSQAACIQSRGGTALIIKEWLEVRHGSP